MSGWAIAGVVGGENGYLYSLSVSCTIRDTMGFDTALRCSLQWMGKMMMREKRGRSGQWRKLTEPERR